MSIRVRYPPSPTGLQHIGSVRTALFNYLFARSQGGRFILRIEDTDQGRYDPRALQNIYDTFSWLGIEWDEGPDKGGDFGPYVQTERRELYQQGAETLIERGGAYRCYCSPERVEEIRQEQTESKKGPIGYDGHCRSLTSEQIAVYEAEGRGSVVRLKVPTEGTTVFNDVLLGEIKFKNRDITPDPVILKSDGLPTYHLANVIDDHRMEISHIFRAQEWLPSVPLHVLMYQAFGWEPPEFVHLPMVLGKDGQKLGKRHGSTAVSEFRREGYLPEALINYLALVGWSLDDATEFFTLGELEKVFSIERINKAAAIFDYQKLVWFNGNYIRKKDPEELRELLLPYLTEARLVATPPTPHQIEILKGAVPLIQERLRTLAEAPDLLRFLFGEVKVPAAEDLIPKKMDAAGTVGILRGLRDILPGFADRNEETLEGSFRELAATLNVKLGQLLMPLRVAITGSSVSPPLVGSMKLIGEDHVLARVDRAIAALEQ